MKDEFSEQYNFGHEEGYKSGYEKGWADCEFQQKGAVKTLTKQIEELRQTTGLAELEEKVGLLQTSLDRCKHKIEAHKPCDCDICQPEWR